MVGALTFYIFVYFLEGGMHTLCLGVNGETPMSAFINANPWAYVLYAGFAAGIFEETGRFLAFKWILKKQTGPETGVMYGIGHGGIEAILVCTLNMVSYLAFAFSLNALGADAMMAQAGDQAAAMQLSIATVSQTPSLLFCVSGLERVIAIALHIALSVLVFSAVHHKGKFYLYPLAILFHAAVDCFACLYNVGVISSIWMIELGVAAMTGLIVWYAVCVYRKDRPANPDASPAGSVPEAAVPAESGDAGVS